MQRVLFTKIAFTFLVAMSFTLTPHQVEANPVSESFPPATRYALIAQKLSDNIELTPQSTNQYFPPASTLKVITALAAKMELGDEFRFQTQLTRNKNNYSIVFSGDPTLTSDQLKKLLSHVKSSNSKVITGDIWLDNTVFSGYEKAVGWPWDIVAPSPQPF